MGWHVVVPWGGTYSGIIHMPGAGKIVRFRTKKDRIRADQAEHLRRLIREVPDLPEAAVGVIVAAIDRQTAAQNGWTFVMLSPNQNRAVVRWLTTNSKRPIVAVQLWAELFSHLDRDSGEIMQSRDELANALNVQPEHVSAIMSELEDIGAISRKRVKVAGLRGPGMVRYFMSPCVATHLSGKARDDAQAQAGPLLRLMEGGRVDP